MSRFRFTTSFTVAGSARTTTAPPPPSPPQLQPSRVRDLLEKYHPRNMLDNMALIIMDQTYSALLEILGPEAPPSGDGHVVQVSRPVDPADPESLLLTVNASAAHCCISLMDTAHGAGDPLPYTNSQHRLARATITTAPGTLHLARVDGGRRGDGWTCADVRPDVANRGLLGVLETVMARVDAAIRMEARLLRMVKGSGCRSTKIGEVVEVRVALERMRRAVDLDAIMRRRCRQNRRRRLLVQEKTTCCRAEPDVDQAYDVDVDALAEGLSALHVGQKRGRPAEETSCRLVDEDDGDELAKRLKALQV